MKPNTESSPAQPQASRRQPLVLAIWAFVLGIALATVWFHKQHHAASENGGLSAATKNLLGQLQSPVSIRYYSLLPSGSADESLQAFGGRVSQLLAAVQAAGGDKIQLSSVTEPAETNITAATTDGIQPFNLDKGDACFLGLAIVGGKNKETFARLQPEWEPALEYDLGRAIARVAAVAPAKPAPEIARPSPEIIAAVNRLIPDVSAVSVEQASQIFHAEFVAQCGAVGADLETQVNAAQQQVVQAQNGGSESDLEAARQHLQQVQLAQGEKLKQLAANLQTQLAVFQQLKAATTPAK